MFDGVRVRGGGNHGCPQVRVEGGWGDFFVSVGWDLFPDVVARVFRV